MVGELTGVIEWCGDAMFGNGGVGSNDFRVLLAELVLPGALFSRYNRKEIKSSSWRVVHVSKTLIIQRVLMCHTGPGGPQLRYET